MSDADVVLRADGLGKRYRQRWALRDCSLELPRGRVAALVGPNGAGKSTFFALATGLLAATEGGLDVLGHDPAAGMPAGASFLAQGKPLPRSFRVAEVLRAGAALNRGVRWDAAYAARLVDAAGVASTDRVGELSAGQRARVALAVALGRRPELLLLDEPLAELDPLARHQVLATLLAETAETGATVLMSSHVLGELEDSCDHLVLLREGRVRLDGPVDDLLDAHRVLVGPTGELPAAVHASTVGRQTTALVRDTAIVAGFRSQRPTLDALVLGYLQEESRKVDAT